MRAPVFPISVIGEVHADYPGRGTARLSPASRQLLAALVAAGPTGVAAVDLARRPGDTMPVSDQAVRMAATRLRSNLPAEVFPRADDGVYRLMAANADVDVWRLESLATGGVDGATHDELRHLLQPVDPYRDVVPSPMLEDSDRRIRRLQRDLVVQLGRRRPDLLRGELLEFAVAHTRGDPTNEVLLAVTVTALVPAGERRLGLDLVRQCRRTLSDIGLDLSDAVADLERDLLDGSAPLIDVAVSAPEQPVISSTGTVPNQLRLARTGAYVGRRRELDALAAVVDGAPARPIADGEGVATNGLTPVLLSGRSGAGKTRLCAEVAVRAADRGWTVLLVAPSLVGAPTPLGPLAAALPDLVDDLTRIVHRGADADSTRLAIWQAARAAVERRATAAPLLLIVDDAQWLDDGTTEFFAHLLTVSTTGRIVLVVNGRHDVAASDGWSALRQRLTSFGATPIEMDPLDRSAISAFVDDRRPGMNGALLAAVTDEILERSAGLPGVAGPLLAAVPDGSAVIPSTTRGPTSPASTVEPLAPAIAGLSTLARRVGIGAAVVGPRFRFDELQAVSDLPAADLLDGLDELIERDLVVDASVVEYEVAHALVEAALLSVATSAELAHAHLVAAEYHRGDVHRRAHHLRSALPLGDVAATVDALRRSADAYAAEGLHREATRRFDAVLAVDTGALSAAELGRYARALDLSGSLDRARSIRRDGFERAAAAGDWAMALEVAASGLPEAEPIDGDRSIADQLVLIDATTLTRRDAWRHATIAARQLTIVGDGAAALDFAARADELAESPPELVATALARRFAMSGLASPQDCLAVMLHVDEHLDQVDDTLLGDYLLNLALDHHQAGDLAASAATIDRLERVDGRSVVKVWQAMLMRAMHLTDAGDIDAANAMRVEAHAFASTAGLGEADNALLAAIFVDQWLAGGAALFADEVHGGAMDPSRTLLTKAGAAAVLLEVGDAERAGSLAVEVAEEVLASSNPIGLPALLVVCRPLAAATASGAPGPAGSLVADVRARLLVRRDSMVVIGAGAANLGPVARYLAELADTDEERRDHLVTAARLADRSGSALWRSLCPLPT